MGFKTLDFLAADHHRCIFAADHHCCLVLLHVDVVPEVFGACLGASDDRGSLSHHSTARPFYFLKGYSHCHLQSRQKKMSSPRYLSLGLNAVVVVLIEPDHRGDLEQRHPRLL